MDLDTPDLTPNPDIPSGPEDQWKHSNLRPKIGRKGHKKSRNGCKTCKKRKVKCDEVKPECGNCIRFGVCCEFAPDPSYVIRPRHADPQGPRCRGRPRIDWASWAQQLHTDTNSPRESFNCFHLGAGIGTPSGAFLQPINVEDLQLFHHYYSTAAATFGDVSIWRDNAPQLGTEYPCIFHGMMAIAAHHLATLRTAKTPRYLLLADLHFEAAVQGATQLLPDLSVDNCQPLYVVTALICLSALARGPAAGELLIVSKGGKVPFFSLFRGLRMVMRTISWDVIFSGLLQTDESPWSKPGEHLYGTGRLTGQEISDREMSLNRLFDLVQSSAKPPLLEMYLSQVTSLTKIFQRTFGTANNPKGSHHGDLHGIMTWVFLVQDDFVDALEAGEPIALLSLGHFSLMMRSLEYYWFMHGWSSHILREVKQILGEPFEGWLP